MSMYPEAEAMGDTDQAPSAGMPMGRQRRPEITHERRIALQDYARKIAGDVLENTRRHERCLLRQMVEQLLPGED